MMKRRKKIWLLFFVLVLVFLIIIPLTVGLFNYFKPTPENITYESEVYSTDSVEFLYDLTYADNDGAETHEQEIFDEVFGMIDEAEEFLLDCMAVVVDSVDEVWEYFEEEGLDMEGADKDEILEASEVFDVGDGRYLIVEA